MLKSVTLNEKKINTTPLLLKFLSLTNSKEVQHP